MCVDNKKTGPTRNCKGYFAVVIFHPELIAAVYIYIYLYNYNSTIMGASKYYPQLVSI